MSTLVIVESPAKARTLSGILGKGYRVEASLGHVRDLPQSAAEVPARYKKEPWARLGVDVQRGFEPLYVIPEERKDQIKKLKAALAKSDALLLATDEDREGESISWHVTEILKPEVPVQRIVFHEITDEAIHEALERPRAIDDNLVRAQESRRILDRLFGYELSPVLWKKVRTGLSAGRVQSVAVRLLVERERERRRFRTAAWFDAEARFERDGQGFTARLVRIGERTVATGSDFDATSGALKTGFAGVWLDSEERVRELLAGWPTPWRVAAVEQKPFQRRPAPPFTTSTLQQEANRKLRFSARRTMRVAQRLYEGVGGGERVGLITYMRTDSVHLAERALRQAQAVIRELYGNDYTTGPRHYKTKSKLAQEAHEAIRPTDLARRPERLRHILSDDEFKLYELIWKRTLASQMAEARLRRTTVDIEAPVADGGAVDESAFLPGIFQATGTVIDFPGFLRVYVEGSDDPQAELAEQEVVLPRLADGDELTPESVEAKGHETQPPARYTEASLVKKLEEEGIGRPSTYAPTLSRIQERGYVFRRGNALVPTFTGVAVTIVLERHFPEYVDVGFTARMEERLDQIAEGELDWQHHLRRFYFGDPGEESPGLEGRIAAEEPNIEFPEIELGRHPETDRPIVVRVGRFGPYLQYQPEEGETVNASVPEDEPPADLTVELALELLRRAARGDKMIGHDPESLEPIYLRHGRYGAYVQLGETPEKGSKAPKPKRASLPKGTAEDEVTLAEALKWLSLPRELGAHSEDGEPVLAKDGPYGPYVEWGKERRSLEATDDVYSIEMERALELLAQPKGRRGNTRKVLAEFETPDGTVQLLTGRYGPYLTDGKKNASLRKSEDPESLTPEQVAEIFAERAKAPKRKRK